MGAPSELTLGEIGQGLARYRPVALTVGAILLAITLLPRPDSDLAEVAEPILGRTAAPATGAAPAVSAAPEATSVTSAPSDFGPVLSSPAPTFSSPSSSPSPSAAEPDFSSPTTTFVPAREFTFAPTTSSDQPLRIVAKAWATRTAGTPLAGEGVRAGTLPVGTRAGQDDKLSFVRLSGDEAILRLVEDSAGGRTVQGPVAVQACRISTGGWKEAEAMAIADAPAYDPGSCVEGNRSLEGVWLFDLSIYSERTDDRGFALRPGKGAGLDSQVGFKPG